jgi:hypothetical protein
VSEPHRIPWNPGEHSSRSPSRLLINTYSQLGDSFRVMRCRGGCWRVDHYEQTWGVYIYRRNEPWRNQFGRQKFRARFYIYDGDGGFEAFSALKDGVAHGVTQIRALLAAKRLGYESGKTPS